MASSVDLPAMTHAYKRCLVPALLLTVLAACSPAEQTGDTAGNTTSTSPEDRTLAYAQCMRDNGVPEFPDPSPDGGLRIGSEVDPNSAAFKSAQQACQDLAPQGAGGGGGAPLDSAKVAEWAQCIRDNGVPSFPDPEINGGSMALDFGTAGISRDDPAFQAAMDTCRPKWPGGGVMIQGGGGQ
jgi:hypothetical protein